MTLQIWRAGKRWAGITTLLTASLLLGCASASVKWNERVGVYSWDDALTELGAPDRVADMEGGVKAAEWIESRSPSSTVGEPAPSYTRAEPVESYATYGSRAPNKVLRLTFTPDGKLLDWDRNH